jgi:hypothetical protein
MVTHSYKDEVNNMKLITKSALPSASQMTSQESGTSWAGRINYTLVLIVKTHKSKIVYF